MWRKFTFGLFAVLAGCSLSLGWAAEIQDKPKLLIVTSFSILQDITQQLSGDRAEVISLVQANEDAHTYQPKPSDLRLLVQADLIIDNGLGFTNWMPRLISASKTKAIQITASQGIEVLSLEADDHDAHGHIHASEQDPHAWQSLIEVQHYIRNISTALIALDPEGAAYYKARSAAYLEQINNLHAEFAPKFAQLPEAKRKVMVSHAAFGYLAATYNLEILAVQGVSTSSEPSAQEMASLVRQLKEQQITAVFMENIGNKRLIEQLQRAAQVSLGGVLYSDTLSDASGPAATYLQMMRTNLTTLIDALEE